MIAVSLFVLIGCATHKPWQGFLANGVGRWEYYLNQEIDIRVDNKPLAEVLCSPLFPDFNVIISSGKPPVVVGTDPFAKSSEPEPFPVTLHANGITRREALWRISQQCKIEMVMTEQAVYIQPRLRTVEK